MSLPNKKRQWQQIRAKVRRMDDALGEPIDAGIRDTVVGLIAHGFPTSQSCEGHLDRGHPYPWVEIYPQEPRREHWQEDETLREAVAEEAEVHRQRMLQLLEEFNRSQAATDDAVLGLTNIGYGFRLQNVSGCRAELLPGDIKALKLEDYQKQMDAFAEFLRQKYFA